MTDLTVGISYFVEKNPAIFGGNCSIFIEVKHFED